MNVLGIILTIDMNSEQKTLEHFMLDNLVKEIESLEKKMAQVKFTDPTSEKFAEYRKRIMK